MSTVVAGLLVKGFGVLACAALALTAAPAHAIIVQNIFHGGGVVDGRSLFISWSSADGSEVAARVGFIWDGGRPGEEPARGFFSCAEFVPHTRQDMSGGTLYAVAIIDDNKRLVKAVDNGPGGMDEVGFIIVNSQPDPTRPLCGASDVATSPLFGNFVGGRAVV